ncbi:MAG TPA: hypothetical protein VIN59_06450 [Alphaproteobacteria bacterium]
MIKLILSGFILAVLLFAFFAVMAPILLGLAAIYFGVLPLQKHLRYRALLRKYGNESLARMLANKTIWENQTAEQLNDALGAPLVITQQDGLEIRTYRLMSMGRFNTQVVLQDGLVRSWTSA